jgi:hypothetical protein
MSVLWYWIVSKRCSLNHSNLIWVITSILEQGRLQSLTSDVVPCRVWHLFIELAISILHVTELCHTTTIAFEAIRMLSEQWHPVHNCSARTQVIQLAYTKYEDTGCRPTRKNPSTAWPCTSEDKVGKVLWLIFGSPWIYIYIDVFVYVVCVYTAARERDLSIGTRSWTPKTPVRSKRP